MAQLRGREAIDRLAVAQRAGQRLDQQRHGGQTLLAVDHEQGRPVRDLRQPLLDVDDRTDEMHGDGVARARAQDVVPQLAALLVGPQVGALVDRDHELRRLLQEAQQLGFGSFHRTPPSLIPETLTFDPSGWVALGSGHLLAQLLDYFAQRHKARKRRVKTEVCPPVLRQQGGPILPV